ncbi:MAG: peptidoglycan DD-metalloendopeptidase family protein [Oscillospiraceae bacterium]|jgi:murein DD-endopeptidase MepM/ murein hydrolase activator NlpD|nr:peptidoglycan DD-metalloendopeptidase family protein [Oscillospiraceae bacterium]
MPVFFLESLGERFWAFFSWLQLGRFVKKTGKWSREIIKRIYYDILNIRVLFSNLGFALLRDTRSLIIRLNKAFDHFRKMAREERPSVIFKEFVAFCRFKYSLYKRSFWRFIRAVLAFFSFLLCFFVIRYVSHIEYGIEIRCEGKFVGLVENEFDFWQAQKLVRERILEPTEEIYIKPEFTVCILNSQKITSHSDLADGIMRILSDDIVKASGIYLDGEFLGATTEKTLLEKELDEIKLKNSKGLKQRGEILWEKILDIREAVYPKSSLLPFASALKPLLNSTEVKEIEHVVEEGETIEGIISSYEMTEKEFKKLNPGTVAVNPGDGLRVRAAVPLLGVKVVATEVVRERVPFKSVKIYTSRYPLGESFRKQRGVDGEADVTYNVTYIRDEQQARVAVSQNVIKEAVDEQIIIGQRRGNHIYDYGEIVSDVVDANFIWPVDGKKGYVSCYFSPGGHRGVDICSEFGTPILASDAGTVISAGLDGTYGKSVVIRHENGLFTRYAHNSEIYVKVGQVVVQGEHISAMGRTGNASGVHLHFEILKNGTQIDPRQYIER